MVRKSLAIILAGAGMAVTMPACAEPVGSEVRYAAEEPWVKPHPPALARQVSSGALDVIFNDTQVRIVGDTVSTSTAYRMRILRSEALALGNVSLVWDPDTTLVTVHRLLIHRGDQVIDVLKSSKFSIFQREGRLEQAMLDGMLTASLQIPGLRIGDEVEFAMTTEESRPPFPGHVFGAIALPGELAPGSYHVAMDWERNPHLRWQATKDLTTALTKQDHAISATLLDPPKIAAPAFAPARFGVARLIEYSGFDSWQAVSASTSALFKQAARLPDDAALKAEIGRIAKSGAPRDRALGALQLVQDHIRYVFTGMNGGNYHPAPATETWERRFGDCKGKAAMLLAVLAKLGIPAQAVLVNSGGGDGFDERLPSPVVFDHVVVRTVIAGQRYWLDGTRTGEGRLLTDGDVPYRWVLPLSDKGEPLERIEFKPLTQPSEINFVDIDASAGVDTKAKVTLTRVLRGDGALGLNQALQSMSRETAEASMRQQAADGWIDPQSVDWRYDADTGAMTLVIKGVGDIDWDKNTQGGQTTYTYYLPAGGFYKPDKLERPTGQDTSAPYANDPRRFSCNVTQIKLPAVKGQSWSLETRSMDRVIGGIAYYRTASFKDNIARLIRSSRTLEAELTPNQAIAANRLLPTFDDKKTWVESQVGVADARPENEQQLPDPAKVDWARDATSCHSPGRP
jgi:hypothetical protein